MTTTAPVEFHLDTDPWLPVTYLDGHSEPVSLERLFLDAHLISGIDAASPPGHASLLRILTALTYRITGLDDAGLPVDAWHEQRNEALSRGAFDPEPVSGYFGRWHHRFSLFDVDRPWRQDPRLRDQVAEPAGLNALIPDRPSGNNAAFFSDFHGQNPGSATIAEAVDALLVRQFYGSLGRCQTRLAPGMPKGTANFTYLGSLRGRVSYHPVAPTLFETLLAHLVPPITFPDAGRKPDLAEWETESLSNPVGVKPRPGGFVSLLANDVGHALLLVPDTGPDGAVRVVDGYWTWLYSDKTAGNLIGWDPYLSYRPKPTGGDPVSRFPQENRDMWRDLPALLADPVGEPRSPEAFAQPAVARAMATLPVALLRRMRMAAHSVRQDFIQPPTQDWSSSLSPAVFESAAAEPEDPSAHQYRTAIPAWVQAAEEEWSHLSRALFFALRDGRNLDPQGKAVTAWREAAAPVFWQRAHDLFDEALSRTADGASFSATVTSAPGRLRLASIDVYDQITASVRDGRGLMAVVKNRPRSRPAPVAADPESVPA